jgi:hypothetical protein
MSMAKFLGMNTKRVDLFERARRLPVASLGRGLTILALIAAACGSARAQYVGFTANSTDNTVSVFAVVTSSPQFGNENLPGNQDHLIKTVPVGINPVRIAVGPNLNQAYVTNNGDSSLWIVDVTNISQGRVTSQNVNPAANPLQLFQPGGIGVADVTTGNNAGHVFAFVANQTGNTVSIVDTGNNTLFGTVVLGSTGNSTTLPEVAASKDGSQVYVANNSTANCSSASSTACPGVFMIDATSVARGTSSVANISVSGGVGNTFAVTAAQLTNNVATLNVAAADTLFTVGLPILVSGFAGNDTYFNGTFTVASISATQVTYNDIHVNGVATTNGTVTNAVVLGFARGITTIQVPVSGTQHTLVGVADSTPHPALFISSCGYIFVLDRTAGGPAIAIPIRNDIASQSTSGVCSQSPIGVTAFTTNAGSIVNAEIMDSAGNSAWLLSDTVADILSATGSAGSFSSAAVSQLVTASAPTSLAVTPDGQFAYVTESSASSPLQVIENTTSNVGGITNSLCFAGSGGCGNASSVAAKAPTDLGSGPTGLAITGLDPSSPAVVWFIPSVSGGFDPPLAPLALGPNGASLAVSGESMVGNVSQPIQTTLSFGVGNPCAIFTTSLGTSGDSSGSPCTSNATNGGNGIGGTGTFPASGVFTISLGTTANGGSATETVSVGANCTANVTPTTNVAVGQTVTANISCTAPVKDQLAGNVRWGDGTFTVSAQQVTANGSTPVVLKFTHQYTSPSPAEGYPVTVTVTDNSTNTAASVTGGPVAVTVLPISVSVNPSPISVQATKSQTFTANVQFDVSNSGVSWFLASLSQSGAACSATTCGTLSNIMPTSVTYTAPLNVPNPPVLNLIATSNASISYADPGKSFSVPITITAIAPPTCTLTAPTLAQIGVTVTATLSNCTAPTAGDSVTATISWGDETTSTSTATAGSSGVVAFNPSSFNHTYASSPTTSLSATITDTTVTGGLTGATNPPSVPIKVISIKPPSSTGTSVTIGQGQPGTFTMNFTGGPAGLKFTSIMCSVSPTGPTCTVLPSTLTLDANGNGSVQVTISTIGPATSLSLPSGVNRQKSLFASLIALPGLGLLLLNAGGLTTRRRRRAWLLFTLLLIGGVTMLASGCGSSIARSNIACTTCTTAGSYTVTVTATSQSPVFQANGVFTVVVQQ